MIPNLLFLFTLEEEQQKKVVQFSEEVSVQLAPKDAVEINEEKIDRLESCILVWDSVFLLHVFIYSSYF